MTKNNPLVDITRIISCISDSSIVPFLSMSYKRKANSSFSSGLPDCVTLIAYNQVQKTFIYDKYWLTVSSMGHVLRW